MNDSASVPNQESYVPKPGEVIKPQGVSNVGSVEPKIFVPVPLQSDQDLLSVQPLISLEKTEEVPVPTTPESSKPSSSSVLKMKFPEIPTKAKRIIKLALIGFLLIVVLGGLFAYFLPMLMPKPQEKPPEQIILPPVVREEPREDKTSLRYLDAKIKDIKPSLDELNNDSVFLFKLKLNESDF